MKSRARSWLVLSGSLAAAALAAQAALGAPSVSHTVKAGDSLGLISREHYQTARAWRLIWAANRKTLASPQSELVSGMRLELPVATVAIAERGETPAAFSRRIYGSAEYATDLMGLNPQTWRTPDSRLKAGVEVTILELKETYPGIVGGEAIESARSPASVSEPSAVSRPERGKSAASGVVFPAAKLEMESAL